MLAAGANINARDSRGFSALSKAASNDRCEAVTTLLKYGAHIETVDVDGDTALMETLLVNAHNALKLLRDAGADYVKTDSYGGPHPQ